ncbi:class I SAM-dependent methyltransferase [Streptosporangium sp. OZ121]|uniref:class I SAM-dependent methyltransferase n=1 Tax=Streptosporangium sp. OZ121 TaxID=3444183 RepID=UPI003F79DD40
METGRSDGDEALARRLSEWLLGGAQLMTVEIGDRLGLYEAIQQAGTVNAAELSRCAGIARPYARQWLEQQAASGLLGVAPETGDGDTRRFFLPPEYAPLLVEGGGRRSLAGCASVLAECGTALPAVVETFRTGEEGERRRHDSRLRLALGALDRPAFERHMTTWIEAMPPVADRLRAGGEVLDVGCGPGWSSIAVALAFPAARVIGVDGDEEAVRRAREHAVVEGVADRVSFSVAGESSEVRPTSENGFDLVCVFRTLGDSADPAAFLRELRESLAPEGALLLVEDEPDETFVVQPGGSERLRHALSVLGLLPAPMARPSSAGQGGAIGTSRASAVDVLAARAGFGAVTRLPIEHRGWCFHHMRVHA